MATDLSNIRFNPLDDYSGVQFKQGAALLDGDLNQGLALARYGLQALALDVLGRATVSQATPNAFKITADPANATLKIDPGRMYVHGMLAANHGGIKSGAVFDPLLGEPAFAGPISYLEQPYFRSPPPLPTTGTHIVYLDVWQREVTHVEESDLIEIAVGVETSSRLQSVWQVRVLSSPSGTAVTCGSEPPEWLALIAPSTGRLSTGYVAVPPLDDPCELPPAGGYRGLENQLYRIEIHDPGQLGQGATFKWSRENASVAFAVEEVISATKLRLQSVGRDDVLGLSAGDWVEVTSDALELAQRAGEMRQITDVKLELRVIELSAGLPLALAPVGQVNSGAELRIKRWDQARFVEQVGPANVLAPFHDLETPSATFPSAIPGVIPVPAAGTQLVLEHGLTVSFSSTGNKDFKPGDYWVLPARTVNAEVEHLHEAPPLGVHHGFARLAVYDADAGQVTDCRTPWPPVGQQGEPAHDCACTACVTPESHGDGGGAFTIQAAVNEVSKTGGTVCLAPGHYRITTPIIIRSARSLRVRGPSPPTKLSTPTPHRGAVLEGSNGIFGIAESDAIELEDLFLSSGTTAVQVTRSSNVGLRHLVIEAKQEGIRLMGAVPNLRISENEVRAPAGIVGLAVSHRDDLPTPSSSIHRNSLTIADNWIDAVQGMSLTLAASGDTYVVRNKLQGSTKGGIELKNETEDSNSLPSTTIADNHLEAASGRAIQVAASQLVIRDNRAIVGKTDVALFVESSGGECHLLRNAVTVNDEGAAILSSKTKKVIITGNRLELTSPATPSIDAGSGGEECVISDNIIDIRRSGQALATHAQKAIIKGNRIAVLHTTNPSVQIGGEAEELLFTDNVIEVGDGPAVQSLAKKAAITNNRVLIGHAQDGAGVLVQNAQDCLFSDNFVEFPVNSAGVPVELKGTGVAIVNANRIKNGRDQTAIDLQNVGKATVIGNITTGRIDPPLGLPWSALNLAGS